VSCFSPISAWQTDSGEIVFAERGKIRRALELPCGGCVGCRLERSRQWAMRCMHEAQLHEDNSFVTLTYDERFCPPSLHYPDFQKFMKRLRKVYPGARFYMCGEYGEKFRRPHFHACLFGVGFRDRAEWSRTGSGSWLYRSPTLERVWPHGFSSIGDVTFESAAYVARYVMKKVTGKLAAAHYSSLDLDTGELLSLVPEFNRMSLKPGIGADWFKKYKSDVYNFDYVVVNGQKCKPPRYYDKLLESNDWQAWEALELSRSERITPQVVRDGSRARLAVREQVANARLSFKKRELE